MHYWLRNHWPFSETWLKEDSWWSADKYGRPLFFPTQCFLQFLLAYLDLSKSWFLYDYLYQEADGVPIASSRVFQEFWYRRLHANDTRMLPSLISQVVELSHGLPQSQVNARILEKCALAPVEPDLQMITDCSLAEFTTYVTERIRTRDIDSCEILYGKRWPRESIEISHDLLGTYPHLPVMHIGCVPRHCISGICCKSSMGQECYVGMEYYGKSYPTVEALLDDGWVVDLQAARTHQPDTYRGNTDWFGNHIDERTYLSYFSVS